MTALTGSHTDSMLALLLTERDRWWHDTQHRIKLAFKRCTCLTASVQDYTFEDYNFNMYGTPNIHI